MSLIIDTGSRHIVIPDEDDERQIDSLAVILDAVPALVAALDHVRRDGHELTLECVRRP